MITTILLLTIVLIASIVVSYNLFKQVEAYEQLLESYESYMAQITELVEMSNKTIQQVDANGHFSSDDEVGDFFNTLKGIQTALNQFSIKNIGSEN